MMMMMMMMMMIIIQVYSITVGATHGIFKYSVSQCT
jgi:hypothetical protein